MKYLQIYKCCLIIGQSHKNGGIKVNKKTFVINVENYEGVVLECNSFIVNKLSTLYYKKRLEKICFGN